jgi:hypothetical protein
MRTFIVLAPEEDRSFTINRSGDFESSDGGRMIRIRCKWRSTRKTLPFYRSVWLWASVKEVQELRDVAVAHPRPKGI